MNGFQLLEALDNEGPNGVRAANCLLAAWGGTRSEYGIDMRRLRAASDKDLLKIPNLGPHALIKIRKFVSAPKK
jgi:hypothetical protein